MQNVTNPAALKNQYAHHQNQNLCIQISVVRGIFCLGRSRRQILDAQKGNKTKEKKGKKTSRLDVVLLKEEDMALPELKRKETNLRRYISCTKKYIGGSIIMAKEKPAPPSGMEENIKVGKNPRSYEFRLHCTCILADPRLSGATREGTK